MQVIKRTNETVGFDIRKIYSACDKAFLEVGGSQMPESLKMEFDSYFTSCDVNRVFTVEQLQNIVEEMLMYNGYYDVARAYIRYRGEHQDARLINERLAYMDNYSSNGQNAATSSETDANANVGVKNVANLNGEVYKTLNRKINRYRMRKKLKELFPQYEQQYTQDLDNHIIYVHDESSTPTVQNYTYSPKESIIAKVNGKHRLLSLESLYRLCTEDEIKQQGDGVWSKFPKDIEVQDRNGVWTKVTRLTRKTRYNDMVRVKTAFGEDIIVTANHPMIIDEDKTNTVPASESEGKKQFRTKTNLTFAGMDSIDISSIVDCDRVYSNHVTAHNYNGPYFHCKRFIKLNRQLGYVVGFFIGDGNYNNGVNSKLTFAQKDENTLKKLAEMLYESFNISVCTRKNNNDVNIIEVQSPIVFSFFKDYLGIKDREQNKNIPCNILDFTPDFAKGIIEGIIDSEGTIVENKMIEIRMSSRECITQLTMLLKYFGYGVSNTIQNTPFGCNQKIQSKYTLFGVTFSNKSGVEKFDCSCKWKNQITKEASKYLKYCEGWSNISSVTRIMEGSFLDSCGNIYDITTESNTFVCNNLWVHNCEAVSLWPFLCEGSSGMDGLKAAPPHNLSSFAGQFCNLVFLLAAQCKGAVAFGEFFNVFDYYCAKDFGPDYHKRENEPGSLYPKKTIGGMIEQYFQQIVYSINQPAGNRCYQSPFTNISYYDSNYWKAMFEDFRYPDGTAPCWERVDYLQKKFMRWFNRERSRTLLTFPVETMALLSDGKDIIDKDYKAFTAQMYAEGHSFFTYISDNPNGLASCCRLRNEIKENVFSFTNGLTGVQTGSVNVITLNVNRIIQDWAKSIEQKRESLKNNFFSLSDSFRDYLKDILERVYAYQTAYKTLVYEVEKNGLLTASNAGYIKMNKLYSTIGVNGINEAAEFVGLKCNYNEDYKQFCRLVTGTISEQNRLHSTNPKFLFNQEFVPAEGLSSKNYNWDKEDGYWVPEDRVLYNSYFYLADDKETGVLEKFRLHGREFTELLDGGVGLHCNLEEHLSTEQYLKLIDYAIKVGTSYFTFNVPNSECTNPDCHHIVKQPLDICPKCGAPMRQWTRIIGYLRPVENFDKYRFVEAKQRYYAKLEK